MCVFVVRTGHPRNRGSILGRVNIFFTSSKRKNLLGADVAYSAFLCITEALSPG